MLEIDTLSVNKRIFNPNVSDQSKAIGIWDLTQASVNYYLRYRYETRSYFPVSNRGIPVLWIPDESKWNF